MNIIANIPVGMTGDEAGVLIIFFGIFVVCWIIGYFIGKNL
jgi:hypothetical protein